MNESFCFSARQLSLTNRCFIFQSVEQPLSHRASVKHGFSCGECLGDDDDEGGFNTESIRNPLDINWVHISKESKTTSMTIDGATFERLDSLKDELRSQVTSPNTNTYDVGESLSGMPGPLSLSLTTYIYRL